MQRQECPTSVHLDITGDGIQSILAFFLYGQQSRCTIKKVALFRYAPADVATRVLTVVWLMMAGVKKCGDRWVCLGMLRTMCYVHRTRCYGNSDGPSVECVTHFFSWPATSVGQSAHCYYRLRAYLHIYTTARAPYEHWVQAYKRTAPPSSRRPTYSQVD